MSNFFSTIRNGACTHTYSYVGLRGTYKQHFAHCSLLLFIKSLPHALHTRTYALIAHHSQHYVSVSHSHSPSFTCYEPHSNGLTFVRCAFHLCPCARNVEWNYFHSLRCTKPSASCTCPSELFLIPRMFRVADPLCRLPRTSKEVSLCFHACFTFVASHVWVYFLECPTC